MASREEVVQALLDAAKVCADEAAQHATRYSGPDLAAHAAAARDFAAAAETVHGVRGRGVSA